MPSKWTTKAIDRAFYRTRLLVTQTQLPQDGDLSTLTSVHADSPSTEQRAQSSEEDPYEAYLMQPFIPNAVRSQTEQEIIRESIQNRQTHVSSSTLMWPTIGRTPINEFTTEGYFSMAFPTFFPTVLLISLDSVQQGIDNRGGGGIGNTCAMVRRMLVTVT